MDTEYVCSPNPRTLTTDNLQNNLNKNLKKKLPCTFKLKLLNVLKIYGKLENVINIYEKSKRNRESQSFLAYII